MLASVMVVHVVGGLHHKDVRRIFLGTVRIYKDFDKITHTQTLWCGELGVNFTEWQFMRRTSPGNVSVVKDNVDFVLT